MQLSFSRQTRVVSYSIPTPVYWEKQTKTFSSHKQLKLLSFVTWWKPPFKYTLLKLLQRLGGGREKEKKKPNKQSKQKMKAKTTPYAGEKGDNQQIQESQKLNIKT